MRYTTLLFVLFVFFTACHRPPQEQKKTNTTVKSWIPNWHSNDTLYGPYNVGDSMITLTIGDTSCIIYHGVKLYVWKESWVWDSVNTMYYTNCRINNIPFDTTGCWAPDAVVVPSQMPYNGQIAYQRQSVVMYPPKSPTFIWNEYISWTIYN
jgi:hypothetical protein